MGAEETAEKRVWSEVLMEKTYSYYCTQRPACPGAIPRGVVEIEDLDPDDAIPEIHRGAYSKITYDRQLTPSEIWAFELTPVQKEERT